MAEKKETKKVIDVSHPGDSEPSATAKPVIVTNRPVLKDPMVVVDESAGKEETSKVDAEEKTDTEEHKIEVKKAGGIKLKTLEEAQSEKEEVPTSSETEEEPKDEAKETSSPQVEESPTETPEEVKPESSTEVQSSIINDNGDTIKDPDDADKEAAQAAKKEEELQKLVDTKKYYLPINSVEKRRTHRTIVIGLALSLLLGLAWLNIALDAGLFSLGGVQAVTDFF